VADTGTEMATIVPSFQGSRIRDPLGRHLDKPLT
jgi:hypothetical protein